MKCFPFRSVLFFSNGIKRRLFTPLRLVLAAYGRQQQPASIPTIRPLLSFSVTDPKSRELQPTPAANEARVAKWQKQGGMKTSAQAGANRWLRTRAHFYHCRRGADESTRGAGMKSSWAVYWYNGRGTSLWGFFQRKFGHRDVPYPYVLAPQPHIRSKQT